MNQIHEIAASHWHLIHKSRSEYFEKCAKENSTPPIKGEITKGKLKWRGITLCYQPSTGMEWLEQRGKIISEKVRNIKL